MANPEDYMSEGRPYRPSNGTEGDGFQSRWCNLCANDDVDEDILCPILGKALCGDQPDEWVYRNRQPTCTKFVRFGEEGPLPLPRCERTPDFFSESQ